jgi:hypothetical protein
MTVHLSVTDAGTVANLVKEFPPLKNLTVDYCVRKSPHLFPILSKLKAVCDILCLFIVSI